MQFGQDTLFLLMQILHRARATWAVESSSFLLLFHSSNAKKISVHKKRTTYTFPLAQKLVSQEEKVRVKTKLTVEPHFCREPSDSILQLTPPETQYCIT
jgi:hypothetical protein